MKKKDYLFKMKGIGKTCFLTVALATTSLLTAQDLNLGLKLHYTFETAPLNALPDASENGYNATLMGGATIGNLNGKNSVILDKTGTNYVDMGTAVGGLIATLTDFSISCYVWENSTATLASGGMVCLFSNTMNVNAPSPASSVGYLYFSVKSSIFSITTTNSTTAFKSGTYVNIPLGKWVLYTFTQSGITGKLYQDGVEKVSSNVYAKSTTTLLNPSLVGAVVAGGTQFNYLCRSPYTTDAFFMDGQIADFRIYNRALSPQEVSSMVSNTITGLNTDKSNQDILIYSKLNNQITVSCKGGFEDQSSVIVYNALGNELLNQKLTNETTLINRAFTSGVYLVTVHKSGQTITKKVII